MIDKFTPALYKLETHISKKGYYNIDVDVKGFPKRIGPGISQRTYLIFDKKYDVETQFMVIRKMKNINTYFLSEVWLGNDIKDKNMKIFNTLNNDGEIVLDEVLAYLNTVLK